MYRDEIGKHSPYGSERIIDRIIDAAWANTPLQYKSKPWTHPELNHGVALLATEDALNCYIAAYGEAHKRKALKAFELLPFADFEKTFEICDWGCGQGVAIICLLQVLRSRRLLKNLRAITLVEPSRNALDRAILNIRIFDPTFKINQINKGLPAIDAAFECVEATTLKQTFNSPNIIHLFSNVLDIESIDLKRVAEILAAPGKCHYIVCIGPSNRNEDRINAFSRYFDKKFIEYYRKFREAQFYTNNVYEGHTFGCFIKIFKFNLIEQERGVIPYKFYAPKQFFAAYISDIYTQINNENELRPIDCAFDVYAPFDIGANVYKDIHPVYAVLNNIITRDLPTKLSPWIESCLSDELGI